MFPSSNPKRNHGASTRNPIPLAAARYVSFRGDTENFDARAVEDSEKALAEYRAEYHADELYPYRMIPARHTGLPAHLNGFLAPDIPLVGEQDARETAQLWMSQSIVSRALYGLDWGELRERKLLRHDRVRRLENDKAQWSAHVYYQQWFGALPVYGGQVVCHLTTDTRRNAVTSSYFPIKADSPLTQAPAADEFEPRALQSARAVFLQTLTPADAVDLYWDELAEWLAEQPPERQWDADDAARLERLKQGLDARGWKFDAEFYSRLPRALMHADLNALRQLARETRRGPAQLALAPYATCKLFVFPFAGRFYHACRVEYVPTVGTPWRLFVDAQTGAPLGEPEALALFANVYETSADVPGHPSNPAGAPQNVVFTAADENVLHGFAHIFDQNCSPINVSQANDEIANVAFHARAMRDFFVGLANPGQPSIVVDSFENAAGRTIAPGLEMNVGLQRTGLAMGFMFFDRAVPPPAAPGLGGAPTAPLDPCAAVLDPGDGGDATRRVERKLLQFQTDPARTGLATVDGRLVYTPSLDPEVIYHEVAHACMWILNRSPFDQSNVNVPFWRALTEGYADYFARSFAARKETAAAAAANRTNRWAAAAFRDFGDERALSRGTNVAGEDTLAIPNLYPEEQVQGAGMYRVGMIWARALWDIRKFFAAPRNGGACAANFSSRGIADVDRWALHAFIHVVGWVSNFETAAEAFINEAQRAGQATSCEIEQIKNIFVNHGIYAERGMQAVAQANNVIAAGADAGVRTFDPLTTAWAHPALKDVVALAFDNADLYAAAENGIFKHANFPNGSWQPLGAWIRGETPICMLLESGRLFVGTAHGVFCCDLQNPQWESWNPNGGNSFRGIAFNMAIGELRGDDDQLYRACFVADLSDSGVAFNILTQTPAAQGVGALRDAQTRRSWTNLPAIPNKEEVKNQTKTIYSGRPTALALAVRVVGTNPPARQTDLYVGALGRGVWRQTDIRYQVGFALTQDNLTEMSPNLQGFAVLCLSHDQLGGRNRLLAGTHDGVFEHNLDVPNSGWLPLAGIPPNTIVRCIAPTAGQPLLATYNQGLLFHNGAAGWQPFQFP